MEDSGRQLLIEMSDYHFQGGGVVAATPLDGLILFAAVAAFLFCFYRAIILIAEGCDL